MKHSGPISSFVPLDLIRSAPLEARDESLFVDFARALARRGDLDPILLQRLDGAPSAEHRFCLDGAEWIDRHKLAAYRQAGRKVIPALIDQAAPVRAAAIKSTRPLVIASAEELAGMDARATLERMSEHLVGHLASFQDFLDSNSAGLSPEDAAFQRGIKEGMAIVAIFVGATLEHGFDR